MAEKCCSWPCVCVSAFTGLTPIQTWTLIFFSDNYSDGPSPHQNLTFLVVRWHDRWQSCHFCLVYIFSQSVISTIKLWILQNRLLAWGSQSYIYVQRFFSRFTKLFFEIIFFRWQTHQIPSNFTLRKNLTFIIIIFPMVWFIFTQWKPQLNQKCLCTLLCARMQSMSGYTNKSQQRGKQSRVWFNQTRECRFSFTSTDLLQFT